jgi:hypothetical protein
MPNSADLEAEVKRLEAELERKRLEVSVKRLEAELAATKEANDEEESEYIEELLESEHYIEEFVSDDFTEEEVESAPAAAHAPTTSTASPTSPKRNLVGRLFGRGKSPNNSPTKATAKTSSPRAVATASPPPANKASAGFLEPAAPALPPLPFTPREIPRDPPSPAGEETTLEVLFGPNLYAGGKLIKRSTLAAVIGMDFLMIYFGSKWNRECKSFYPLLKDFYCTCAQANNMECIYISQDRSLQDFKEIFANMPFPAMTTGTPSLKNHLAKELKIMDVPALVILDVNTGYVVTTHAVQDVVALQRNNLEQANELVETWRKIIPIPFSEVVMDKRLKYGKMERSCLYWQE